MQATVLVFLHALELNVVRCFLLRIILLSEGNCLVAIMMVLSLYFG